MSRIPPRRKPREAVKIFRDGREVCNLKTVSGRLEYRRRIELMLSRQGGRCCNCPLPCSIEDATFEHEFGRGLGGGLRDDRIEINGKPVNGASHLWCNLKRGSNRTPIWHGPPDTVPPKERTA